MEYIQNLDKILVDLEQASVIIARAKSQFSQANLKIVGYIYDTDGSHLNISKVQKIFDWPEYINVTSACKFTGVYVYY